MMEVCHNVLDYDYTYSNATFVHVNTMPPEFRFSSKKYKCVMDSHKEKALTLNPNNCRDHLTQHWRKFTQHQINHAKEYLNSSLHCWGATEKFNVRPPELRIFSNVKIYTRVFKTFSKLTELDGIIKGDLETSTFVDALDNECKIISCSIDSGYQFLLECDDNEPSKWPLLNLFLKLKDNNTELISKHVFERKSFCTIPVMTQIHPKNLIKYLYHLILCYGKVECENSAFSSRCFMNAMRKSKLITNEDPQQSAMNLQRKVLLEEHVWLPIRGNALGKRIKASKKSLSTFFNDEQLEASCPLVSELMIKQEAETKIKDAIHNQKKL